MKLEQVKEGDLVADKFGNVYEVLYVARAETEFPVRIRLVSINPQYEERESFHNFLNDCKAPIPNRVGDTAWIGRTVELTKSIDSGLDALSDDEIVCVENLVLLYREVNAVREEESDDPNDKICDGPVQEGDNAFESVKQLTDYELLSKLAVHQLEARRRGLKLSVESVE